MPRHHAYPGGCHCRNIEIRMESDSLPSVLGLRSDTCSFCQKHHALYTSDPVGELHISVRDGQLLQRYRFGTRTADFLICKACGVFVAAYAVEPQRAVVNVNTLDARHAFLANRPQEIDLEGETVDQRLARRSAKWTPVISFVAS